jgi:Uma2 family endonuclease
MRPAAKNLTFEDYVKLDAADWLRLGLPEGRCEYVEGELVELPPESGPNDAIPNYLLVVLVNAGIPLQWIRPGTCEIAVPQLAPKDPRTRIPDLVILQPEHIPLTATKLFITLEMPPPAIVAEAVSPGKGNRERDYHRKRAQYAARGIPEYWLFDREEQQVSVLQLQGQHYREGGVFRGSDRLISPTFPDLVLTAEQLLGLVEARLLQERREAEQRAEQAEQRAEQAEQRAEQAEQRAEQERVRAQQLAEQLRRLGIDLDEG